MASDAGSSASLELEPAGSSGPFDVRSVDTDLPPVSLAAEPAALAHPVRTPRVAAGTCGFCGATVYRGRSFCGGCGARTAVA